MNWRGRRFFGDDEPDIADGTITARLEESRDGDPHLWRMEHDDGDKEDLEEDEVVAALYSYELALQKPPNQDDADDWAGAQQEDEEGGEEEGEEEGGEEEGEEGEEGEQGGEQGGRGGKGKQSGESGGGGGDKGDEGVEPASVREALDTFVSFILKCRRHVATSKELKEITRDGKAMMRLLKGAFGTKPFGETASAASRVTLAPALIFPSSPLPSLLTARKPLWHKLRHVEALWRWLGAIFFEQNEEHGRRARAAARPRVLRDDQQASGQHARPDGKSSRAPTGAANP